MVLVEGHETMSDKDLAGALVAGGAYDEGAAAEVVDALRGDAQQQLLE